MNPVTSDLRAVGPPGARSEPREGPNGEERQDRQHRSAAVVRLINAAADPWGPKWHQLHPPGARAVVRLVMLLSARMARHDRGSVTMPRLSAAVDELPVRVVGVVVQQLQ